MTAPGKEAQLKAELRQIADAIENLTGIATNWNGELELVPGSAGYFGLKPFTCSIRLRSDLCDADTRWRTLIHELFHAVSAGYSAKAFLENIGWEEGVVEKLQRLYRTRVLAEIGIAVKEVLFAEEDERHAFNPYLRALESIQPFFSQSEEEFYLMLIQTPIGNRYSTLLQRALQNPDIAQKRQALVGLSAAHSVLKESLHERT